MSHTELVERYYTAIDEMDGDSLTAILAPEFCHNRPDQTIEGRTQFVTFMLDERPRTDTRHAVETVFLPAGVDTDDNRATKVAAEGRLFDEDGAVLFAFVDLFTVKNGEIVDLRTFTN